MTPRQVVDLGETPDTRDADDRHLRQFVGYRIRRANLLIQHEMTQTLAPFGLRVGTFSALAVVNARPGISQNDLAAGLNIKRSGIVVVVDELEQAGVLKRTPVKGDRRTNALTVTAAGKRLWAKAEQAVKNQEAAMLSGLTQSDIVNLHNLLGRLVTFRDDTVETMQ